MQAWQVAASNDKSIVGLDAVIYYLVEADGMHQLPIVVYLEHHILWPQLHLELHGIPDQLSK